MHLLGWKQGLMLAFFGVRTLIYRNAYLKAAILGVENSLFGFVLVCCFVVFHFYWNVPIRKVIINFNTLSAFSQKAPNQANTLQRETKKAVVW